LLWSVAPILKNESESPEKLFIQMIQNLVMERQIISKKNTSAGQFEVVDLDAKKLEEQVQNSVSPDPETYYWFGTPD